MYTQCPDCRASFRVTAAVLQQAAGRVRCGGCGHAFNALERLSETAPGEAGKPPGAGGRSLLDAFDGPAATDDVRIEGVEWQIVGEEEEAAAADHPQEVLELADDREPEERYDDNSPLPGALDDDEDSRAPEPPRRRAEDFLVPRSPEFEERQVDLALSEPEDWTDLLDEVGDGNGGGGVPEAPGTGYEPALASDAADEDTHSDLQAPEADLEATGEHPAIAADGEPDAAPGEESDAHAAAEADAAASVPEGGGHYVPPQTEEEITINRLIDQELLRLAEQQRELLETSPASGASAEPPPHVETIIMEGAFVRSSLEADDSTGEEPVDGDTAEEIIDLRDTYIRNRDAAHPWHRAAGVGRYAALSAIAALALLLGAQVVHAYRETLATYGGLGQGLSSLYRFAGAPITPEWDLNAWQFESTRGSTDTADSVLTITSRITNTSAEAMPYPLLHVALTDRYEEVIASQLLEAGQYLEIRAASGRVAPGATLRTSITIAPLSPQAAGFKLNVCYPLSDEQVRCATGAFR